MQGSLLCLSRHPEPLDENQLSQLGAVLCSAEPDINISSAGFAGICVFPSSDDKLIAVVSCHQHSLPAEKGVGGVGGGRSVFLVSQVPSLLSIIDGDWFPCTERLFTVSGAVGPSSSCSLAISILRAFSGSFDTKTSIPFDD